LKDYKPFDVGYAVFQKIYFSEVNTMKLKTYINIRKIVEAFPGIRLNVLAEAMEEPVSSVLYWVQMLALDGDLKIVRSPGKVEVYPVEDPGLNEQLKSDR
jgi:hypothetical protein